MQNEDMGTPSAANSSNGAWSLHFLQEDYVSTLSLQRIGHLLAGFCCLFENCWHCILFKANEMTKDLCEVLTMP